MKCTTPLNQNIYLNTRNVKDVYNALALSAVIKYQTIVSGTFESSHKTLQKALETLRLRSVNGYVVTNFPLKQIDVLICFLKV